MVDSVKKNAHEQVSEWYERVVENSFRFFS